MGWSQKERPFCKKTSEYSLSNLVITYFIDGVFEILYKSKVKTPMKLADNWHKYLLAFIKNYNELSKEDRKVMTEVLKKLMKSLIATREKARKEKTKVR